MKRTAILLFWLVIAPIPAYGSNPIAVVFSKHSPALKLASFDNQTDAYRFKGTIALTGTIYLEFDMATSTMANGYVTFEKFVPKKSELSKLPAVISGPYASPVNYVSLDATNNQLAAVFESKEAFARISHGSAHSVSRPVRVLLNNYSTSVECDARGYSAHVVSIAPVSELAYTPSGTVPAGC